MIMWERARGAVVGTAIVLAGPGVVAAELGSERVDEIVVTATSSALRLRDAPASMSVISREALRERPVRDILDAVREVPGVTLSSAAFTRKRINIRGMDSTHTLFLVDGRRVSASADLIAHSDFELGWIPTEAIERIEVVRGPMSALYGSEALGGVVNVITRPVTDEWDSSASFSYGEPAGSGGEEYQAGLTAGGPLVADRLGLRFFVDRTDRSSTPAADDPALSAIEARRATSAGGTLSWTPSSGQRVDFSYQRAEDVRRRDARTPGPPQAAVEYEFRDDVTREQIDVRYSGEFELFSLDGGAYRARLDRKNRRSEGLTPSLPQKLTDDVVDATIGMEFADRHHVLAGGEWRRETLNDGTLVETGSERVQVRSLFVQDRIRIVGDDLTLTLGIRLDDHQRFGSELSPRAYVVWHANPVLTLRGGYGEGFKAPTLKQLSTQFSTFGGGGFFEITGNPDLQPETSRTFELGFLAELERVRLEATAFENRMRDLVQTFCIDNCGIRGQERRTYVNVAEARIRGIETGIGFDLGRNFDFSANYTYLDARDRSTKARLAERPQHSFNARLGWQNGRWSAHTRMQRIGSQTRLAQGQRLDLPNYILWHAGAAFDLNEQFTLRAGVENITNERLADRSDAFDFEERARFVHVGGEFRF